MPTPDDQELDADKPDPKEPIMKNVIHDDHTDAHNDDDQLCFHRDE